MAETKAQKRVVRFKQSFYDNFYGLFDKDEIWEVPEGVVLPRRDIEYIEGAPADAPKELIGELNEDEEDVKPKRKRTPKPKK